VLLTWVQNIKEGIEGRPVSWYSDVFELVFPDLNKESANKMWEKELRSRSVSRSARMRTRRSLATRTIERLVARCVRWPMCTIRRREASGRGSGSGRSARHSRRLGICILYEGLELRHTGGMSAYHRLAARKKLGAFGHGCGVSRRM
jgi:hypothetical protein